MKLFLSVHYQIYEADDAATFDKGKLQEPDRLKFETLRVFFRKKIWGDEFNPWVNQVQNNRNTIHAFKDKDIGSYADLLSNVRRYLFMLRYINYRLPYPDSEYLPHEDLLPNNFSEDIF